VSTAKVSVAIGEDELEWARAVARREGKSLSAVLTESLAERRRLVALREVVSWMAKGEAPLTREELAAAGRELTEAADARPRRTEKPRARRRR
jgi:nucleotide-binding universal stress UspA family protein